MRLGVYVAWKRKMLHDVTGGHQAYIHRRIFRSWLRQRAVSRLRAPQDYKVATLGIVFGISGYIKLVTLYCHAIFWGTEGLGEGCMKIMQIVSCLELMANLFIFIHNGEI